MGRFAAKTLKAKTATVIDDRTAYGQGVAEQFVKEAKANGIEIVDQQFTNSSATDFLGILTSIKSKNPDVIFFGGYASQGAPMVKQMRALWDWLSRPPAYVKSESWRHPDGVGRGLFGDGG